MPEFHTLNLEHENPKLVLSKKLGELDALAEGLKGKLINKDRNLQQQQPSSTIRAEPPTVSQKSSKKCNFGKSQTDPTSILAKIKVGFF